MDGAKSEVACHEPAGTNINGVCVARWKYPEREKRGKVQRHQTLAATQKRTPSLAGNDLFLTSTSQQQQPPPPPQQQQQVPFGNEIRRKFA
ncbi:unnamed protein product [Lampetra fluviatilis]